MATQTFYNVIVNKTAGTLLSVGGSTTTLNVTNFTETLGNFTAPSTLNIYGNAILTMGTFTSGANINIGGNWTNNGGTFAPNTGTVTFNGGSAQLIGGTTVTTFNNIVLNNANGLSLSGIDAPLNSTLTFTNGKITTGANTLIMASTSPSSIVGAALGKYVYGNLRKGIANIASATQIFEIGDASNYTPVNLSFSGTVSGSGNITAFTVGANEPNILSSAIDESKNVNRYWSLINSGVAGFSNYSMVLNFVAGDVDAGSTTGSFIVGKYNSGWTYPTVGTKTAISTQATGLTSFSTYAVGQGGAGIPVMNTQPTNQTVCVPVSASFVAKANSIPDATVQWQINTGSGFSDLIIASPYSVVTSSASGVTTSTLTVNPTNVSLSGEQYQVIFTNTRGNVISNAVTLTVKPLPTPTFITAPTPVCLNSTGNVYTTQSGMTNYLWTINGGTITAGGTTSSNTATVTWTSSGAKSISINYTASNGCSALSATTQNVTVNALPVPSFTTGPNFVCINSSGNLYTTQTGMTNYQWLINGGTITDGGSISSNTATVTWTVAGAKSISINYTDVNGCTAASATLQSVTVNPLPTPTLAAAGPTSFCQGGTVALTPTIGTALSLNGTNNFAATPNLTSYFSTTSMTVELWFKANSQGVILDERGQANGAGGWQDSHIEIVGTGTTGTVYVNVWNASGTATKIAIGPAVAYGTWNHAVVRYDGTKLDGFLNGAASTSATFVRQKPTAQYWTIGEGDVTNLGSCPACSTNYFNGQVDEMRIWNIARANGQITAAWNTTVPINSANLVAYYKMDEGSGTTLTDASVNNNTATLFNTPTWINPSSAPIKYYSSYLWSPGSANTYSLSAIATGSYSVNVTDANGCSANTTATPVTVYPVPIATATNNNQSICSGSPIATISLGTSNNVTGTTFTWIRTTPAGIGGTVPASATGSIADITGTFINSTSSSITVTFTITPFGPAPMNCQGSNITATVSVSPTTVGGSILGSGNVCYGVNSKLLTLSGHTGTIIKWQSSINGITWTDIVNTNATYTATNLVTSTQYRAVIQSGVCLSVNSNVGVVTVLAPPSITITTNYCGPSGNVQLSSNAFSSYLWNTGETSQIITVDMAGIYVITVIDGNGCTGVNSVTVATELVTNGNFEAGNTGFVSGYINHQGVYVAPVPPDPGDQGLVPEGLYAVGTNANLYHPSFFGKDHTTGSGKFMMVNGDKTSILPIVWTENITILPNTDYYFSAFAMSLNQVPPYAQLQFQVNEEQVGTIASLTPGASTVGGPFNWVRFYGTWNSGSSTSATISIVDLNTAAGGNDFGLDDISCSTLSPITFTVAPNSINSTVCAGDEIGLAANVSGGKIPFYYSWTGPNSFTSSAINPIILNSTGAMTGTYNVTVTNGYGCSASGSTVVTVGVYPSDRTVTAVASNVCSGSGTTIQVASSEIGVSYQLRNSSDNTDIGIPVAGTSGTISLLTGNISTNTTFNVLATNTTAFCSVQMTITPTVSVSTTPLLVIKNQAKCSGTVDLTLPSVTTGSTPTSGATLTYWTNALATISLSNPTTVTTGTYYIKSTVGSCYDIKPVVVIISATPVTTFSFTGTPYCSNSSNPLPVFSGGGVAGTFSSTSGLVFVSTSTGQINLSASTPGTYTVTNTIAPVGCGPFSSTSQVRITKLPVASFNYSSNSLCQNASGSNPYPTYVNGGVAGTFTSDFGLNIISPSTGQLNILGSTPGNYTIVNTIAAANGCLAVSDKTYILVNPYIFTGSVSSSASPGTICRGASTDLNAVSTSYRSALLKEGFNGTLNNWTKINLSSGGTYPNAAWTLQSNAYTYTSGTTTTLFNTNDNSQFYISNSYAQGSTGLPSTITMLQSPAISTMGYTSLSLDFFQYFLYNSGETAKVQVSTNGNTWTTVATYSSNQGSYYLDASNNHVTIFTNAIVDLDAYINQPEFYIRFRYDASYDYLWAIDNVSVTGYTMNYNYAWTSTPVGYTSIEQNPTGVAPITNTSYTVVATNAYGCTSTTTPVSVTVNPLPIVNAGTNSSVCSGSSVSIGSATVSGHSYSWDNSNTLSSSVISNPTATPTVTTTYTLTETITVTGCQNSNSVTITANLLPEANTGSDQVICRGLSTTIGAPVVVGNTYSWTSLPAGFTSNLAEPTVSPTVATTYTLTETGSGGCQKSNSVTITQNPLSLAGTAVAALSALCSGSSTTINLSSSTGIIQWQQSLNGSTWANVTGVANTATYTTPELSSTTYYRAQVTSGVCASVNSNPVTVNVDPTTAGGMVTGGSEIYIGNSTAILTLSDYTGNIKGWQKSSDGLSWTDITPVNTASSYSETPSSVGTWYYRAVVQSGVCAVAYSDYTTVLVKAIPSEGTVEGGSDICEGSSTGTLSYNVSEATIQGWQKKFEAGNWTDITPVNTNSTYSEIPSVAGTWEYRVVVKFGVASPDYYSGSTTVHVNPTSIGGSASVASSPICYGTSTTISLSGHTGAIQWQQSSDGIADWVNVIDGSGANSATYTTPYLTTTTYYQAVVKSGACSSAYSTIAEVSVIPVSVGGTATASSSVICSGSNTIIELTANTGTIQWQQSPDGNTGWVNVTDGSGVNTPVLTTNNLLLTTYYRAEVTNDVCPLEYSSEAKVKVDPAPVAGIASASSSVICTGTNTMISLTGSISGIIQWQQSQDVNTDWVDVTDGTGVNTPELTTYDLILTTYYRAKITSGVCESVYSNIVLITVEYNPVAPLSAISDENNFCAGAFSNIKLSASGGSGTTLNWYSGTCGGTFIGKDNDLIITAPDIPTTYYARWETSACGISNCSNPLSVIVYPYAVGGTATAVASSICSGSKATINLTGYTGSIQWQQSLNGSTEWVNVTGGTGSNTASYLTANLTTPIYYRALVSSGICSSDNSSAEHILINPLPTVLIASNPNPPVITLGGSAILTASGADSYEWSPSTGLSANNIANPSASPTITTTYTVTGTDLNGCNNTANIILTVNTSPPPGIWIGVTNTKWDVPTNWDTGVLPTSSTDVTIPSTVPNMPDIFDGITGVCRNLTITPKASVSVNGTLNCYGDLTLESDPAGKKITGAILDFGTIDVRGKTTINKQFNFSGKNYYCYITSPLKITAPVNIATLAQIGDNAPLENMTGVYYNPDKPPYPFPNIWWLDEAHTHPENRDKNGWKAPSGINDPMTPMKGFVFVVPSSRNIDFVSLSPSGNPFNTGDVSIPITRSALSTDKLHDDVPIDLFGKTDLINGKPYAKSDGGNGWNLIGNPYPCPIDWDLVESTLDPVYVNSTANFFIQTGPYDVGNWGYYNGFYGIFASQYIPAMQAFYVKAENNIQLTFPSSCRTVENDAMNMENSYLKSSKNNFNNPLIRIGVFASNSNNKKDETIIYFSKDANAKFDNKYDAYKLLNTDPEYPNVYSLAGNTKLAMNALPEITDSLIIPIGIEVLTSGKYMIKPSEIENLPQGTIVYLIDVKEGQQYELLLNKEYSFNIKSVDDNNRFFIKFSVSTVGLPGKESIGELLKSYVYGSELYISYFNPLSKRAKGDIYNLAGQKIMDLPQINNGSYKFSLAKFNPGIYFVKIITDSKTYINKILIE